MNSNKVEAAIEEIKLGKMVIVVDDEHPENEGCLVLAAEKVTPDQINFMATHARGLVCLPMTAERLDALNIPLMIDTNESRRRKAFCVSIEAGRNVSTGISAADRAMTIFTAIDPETRPEDLIQPGHIFPLRARRGGVLARAGQTEAAVDLAQMAGLKPAGVVCEILKEDGTMAQMPDLIEFSARHGIQIVSLVELIKYRLRTQRFVCCSHTFSFECEAGTFQLHVYENELDGSHHLALVKGDISGPDPVLLRVHAETTLADVFLSLKNRAGRELRRALQRIEKEGRGVVIYLRPPNREARLLEEIQVHSGDPSAPAHHTVSFRDFGVGAQIISDLGLRDVRVLTNRPKRLVGLEGFGLNLVEQLPIDI